MDLILLAPLISFLVALLFIPAWIKKAHAMGLVWHDMNKFARNKVAGSGGIIMLLGFISGAFAFIAYRIFILKDSTFLPEILAAILVVILASGIGFIDDLVGWQKGGLKRRSRMFLLALSAVPLMIINAGRHEVGIPILGSVDLGILYPLLLIPIGIVGATSTYNFLAGYNGLEAGQGIIILSALAFVAYLTGNSWLSLLALCMVAALLAFLIFNFHPAQVFPGDSLTYAAGSLIAVLSILGNFEKIAVFFFIPYILETALKIRGKLVKYSFGVPDSHGILEMPYDKVYGLEHLAILILKKLQIPATEKKVVYSIWLFQIFVVVLGFLIFHEGIFG